MRASCSLRVSMGTVKRPTHGLRQTSQTAARSPPFWTRMTIHCARHASCTGVAQRQGRTSCMPAVEKRAGKGQAR